MYPSISKRQPAAVLYLMLFLVAAPASAETDMSGWPEWLRTAMLAESDSDRTRTQKFGENASVKLPGKPQDPQAIESGWYLPTDIGEGGLIECYLFTSQPDLATTAVQLGDVNIEQMAAAYGTVGNKSLYHLDAGAIGAAPYFALDWMYTVGDAPEAKAALTKVRIAVNGSLVQACTHNSLGYRETLAKAFQSFVTSLDYPTTAPDPYYREIAQIRFGEQPLGLVWFSYVLDAEGDTEIYMSDAQIVPIDSATIQFGDTSSVSYSYPNGELINQVSAAVENGELVTNLDLRRDAEDNWIVSGTFQGKELDVTLDADAVPLSALGQQFRTEEFLDSEDDRITFAAWVPDADPASFLTAALERIDDDSPHNVRMLIGPVIMDAEVDETGSAKRGSMQAGAATMHIERIYVDGKAR